MENKNGRQITTRPKLCYLHSCVCAIKSALSRCVPTCLQQEETLFRFHHTKFTYMYVVVSVLPLGRFLVSIFSTLSCFPPFSLVPHMTILSETRSAYPIVSFPLIFFLSSDPLSPPSAGFRL